jgi:hypothetical protein
LEEGVEGLQAGIVAYCGDNLELHDFGGFRRVFNSGSICRYCHIDHSSLQETDGCLNDQPWYIETYDGMCDEIETGNTKKKFPIRMRCCFNKLKGLFTIYLFLFLFLISLS